MFRGIATFVGFTYDCDDDFSDPLTQSTRREFGRCDFDPRPPPVEARERRADKLAASSVTDNLGDKSLKIS
jgi:hypothetical protein